MQIRKNTKAFKTIEQIIIGCQSRPDREKLVRLYVTKAGHSINDRISVEAIQGEAGLFYEMNYQAITNNLKSANHQLHQSDDVPGIYFFHTTGNKVWDETPFEFDEAIKKDFGALPDFPTVRKKEKAEKYTFATPSVKSESNSVKKEKVEVKKVVEKIDKGPKQPDYKLKNKINFTDLDKIIIKNPRLSKKDILDYYNKISEHLLPYLKDRPVRIKTNSFSGRSIEYTNLDSLTEHVKDIPAWLETASVSKGKEQLLLCNDKEHLLYFVEIGCIGFNPQHSKVKALQSPDDLVIAIESPDASLEKAIDVALVIKDVLSALKLVSFVKTNGISTLDVYLPLDSKSDFETSRKIAEYICKLARIKIPDLVSLNGSDDNSYGKVSLDYAINGEGKSVVAPYSFLSGDSSIVSTPLLWEEVNKELNPDNFNHETIFKRLKQIGDPFEHFFKKKHSADALLERLEANYAFLF